jgi:transcriptional regulator with XRE-family HTH domain
LRSPSQQQDWTAGFRGYHFIDSTHCFKSALTVKAARPSVMILSPIFLGQPLEFQETGKASAKTDQNKKYKKIKNTRKRQGNVMSRSTTKEFFIKERLTEVREARGLTQTGVAKSLQKSHSTISNWERGEQAPEPAALEQLAGLMNVPTGYFRQPMPEYGDGAIFFRSLANATSRVRRKEKARVRWLQHISLTLQRTLDFPEIKFPQLLSDGEYKALHHADLENIAESMRKHWNLGEAPIKHIILVAENAGAVVGVDSV